MGKLFNRAMMTVSGTPGTGTITLGGAVSGYQTFAAAGVANGDVISYLIEDGTNWEYGQGTYTSSGTTLARTTVQGSSNSGAAISASSSARVFVSALVSDITNQTRLITTSGSLTGGGDLSADRTLAYSGDGAWTTYINASNTSPSGLVTGWTAPATYTVVAKWSQPATKTISIFVSIVISSLGSGAGNPLIALPNALTGTNNTGGIVQDQNLGTLLFGYVSGTTIATSLGTLAAHTYTITCNNIQVN